MWYKKEVNKNIYFRKKSVESLENDILKLSNEIDLKELKIFLGLDIAKDFHYSSLILSYKDKDYKIYDIGEIKNSFLWFSNLNIIFEIFNKYNLDKNNIFIWMEATGSYHFSLLQYLNEQIQYKNVYVINPAKIKQFKRWYQNSSIKTDKDDSIFVAKYMFSYKQYLQTDEIEWTLKTENNVFLENKTNLIHRSEYLEVSNLRFLYRQLFSEKAEYTKIKSKIKELTNRIIPEIYEVFNPNKYSKMELYIKSNFTKEEIINMSEDDFYKDVMNGTQNKEWNKKSYPIKLKKLQELLKNSVWLKDSKWIYKKQMKLLVDKYDFYSQNILKIEEMISEELDERGLFIPQIYWVSKVSLWIFYSEMGSNIFHKNLKELIWFIGWYPVEISSWGKALAKPRLQTRWNYMLRRATYLIIYSMLSHLPEINQYKIDLMKKKNIKARQAMVEAGTKILRMILSLFKNKTNYNSDLLNLKILN